MLPHTIQYDLLYVILVLFSACTQTYSQNTGPDVSLTDTLDSTMLGSGISKDTITNAQNGSMPPGFHLNRSQLSHTRLSLSFSQSLSSGWAQQTSNFISLSVALYSTTANNLGPLILRTSIDARLNGTWLGNEDREKHFQIQDNTILAEAQVSYWIGWIADPFFAAGFQTPITESFYYSQFRKEQTAKLWDPVTSHQTLGISWGKNLEGSSILTRIGISLMQIRSMKHSRLTDDFSTREVRERYRSSANVEWLSEAFLQLDSNMTYQGRLLLMGDLQDLNVWMVNWDNNVHFQLWRFFGVTLGLQITHDVRNSLHTQFRQSLMLGLAHTI